MSIVIRKANSDETNTEDSGSIILTAPLRSSSKQTDSDAGESSEEDDDITVDPFIKLISESPESPLILDHILQELATEVYSLKRDRKRKGGQSTTQISARRVDGLKKMGDIWLKRKELTKRNNIDVKSPEFQAILTSLLDKVKITMLESSFSKEMQSVFFTKLSVNLVTWEEEVSKLLAVQRDKEPEIVE